MSTPNIQTLIGEILQNADLLSDICDLLEDPIDAKDKQDKANALATLIGESGYTLTQQEQSHLMNNITQVRTVALCLKNEFLSEMPPEVPW